MCWVQNQHTNIFCIPTQSITNQKMFSNKVLIYRSHKNYKIPENKHTQDVKNLSWGKLQNSTEGGKKKKS